MDFTKPALFLISQGISVVPLKNDSKLPKIKWKPYMTRLMTTDEVNKHFKDCGGIAAITGEVSRLYLLDFDLKYQRSNQDYWKDFMEKVPKALKYKMLINKTKNNGFHIWMRTDYVYKSTHLTRRASTIPELMDRHNKLIDLGKTTEEASELLLRKPFEVIIETRSYGSYGVITHTDYTRFYGKAVNEFSKEEVELLNEIARSLDYCYLKREVYTGSTKNYSTVKKYNETTTGRDVLDLLVGSGMFSYVETERTGNITVLRIGSNSQYSGRIYGDTGVLHMFTSNSMFDIGRKSSFSPFEVYCTVHNFTVDQAINELNKGL